MLKTIRLLSISLVACFYVMLTGFDSTTTSTAIDSGGTGNIASPDSLDLEKPPNLPIPLHESNVSSVVTEPMQILAEEKSSHVSAVSAVKSTDSKSVVKKTEVIESKALDISIPFKASETVDLPDTKNSTQQNEKSNIFAADAKKKARRLGVDGSVLMTQEQEVEKRKSLDGAGISIHLKP